jgi:hypothetical protein
MIDYTIGDILIYKAFGDRTRRVQVTERDPDVKNGQPGFDAILLSGNDAGDSVWGYDWQIVGVERRNA